MVTAQRVIGLHQLGILDIALVGGKNASLGEMIKNLTKMYIEVPRGFAITVSAYRKFLIENQINDKIYNKLAVLDSSNLQNLVAISSDIKKSILNAKLSPEFIEDITKQYNILNKKGASFAVRSSATAEDLPNASFAGQHDSFLNIKGIKNILFAIKKVYASLFNERAIVYRIQNKFPHEKVGISAGIQLMVRSDCASSGIMFTLDTETGFDKVVLINSSWGLGEAVVQGKVNPDEFCVYKPSVLAKKPAILQRNLGKKAIKIIYGKNGKTTKVIKTSKVEQQQFSIDDATITKLARSAVLIEKHYKKPMDIEWAQDGKTKKIYIVQARPETIYGQKQHKIEKYRLTKTSKIITKGYSVGQKIGQGDACVITNPKNRKLMKTGQVLITDMTDPDWEPIMKLASAIVTNRGGRTCHAAIVARELGIPTIVGCNDATTKIKHHTPITVSCAEGKIGYVYKGILPIKIERIKVTDMPKLPFKLCMNLADPNKAFFLPTSTKQWCWPSKN